MMVLMQDCQMISATICVAFLVEAISGNCVCRQVYYPTCVFNAWPTHLPTVILLKIDYTLLTTAKKARRFTAVP